MAKEEDSKKEPGKKEEDKEDKKKQMPGEETASAGMNGEESGEEDRLAILEQKVDQILSMLSSKTAIKAADTGKNPAATESVNPTPKPGEGEVKLPKSPAGETDESCSGENDKVNMTEKMVEKKVEEVLKSRGIIKSAPTPRTAQGDIHNDIAKSKTEPKDLAAEFLEKSKKGEVTPGQMNSEIKKQMKEERNKRIEAVFGRRN